MVTASISSYEGITGYLLPGGIFVIVILVLSAMHLNHLFIWMDPEVVEHDKIIKAKKWIFRFNVLLIRAILSSGWVIYRYLSRRLSIAQDNSKDNKNQVKNFKLSAFLVFSLLLNQ